MMENVASLLNGVREERVSDDREKNTQNNIFDLD
jgi:hypothetical protein